jgi:regulator of cell morphogenesis and NO signaling
METNFSLRTVAEIVRSDYRTADVFKKYNINFCCSGEITLQEACALRHIDDNNILHELEDATRNIYLSNNLQFEKWKVDFLIDYIINVHHAYLYQAIPILDSQLTSFVEGHKKKYPELIKIQEIFLELSTILKTHNIHEEEIIFPYIKQIDTAYRKKESYGNLFVRTLRKPLSNVEKEHDLISGLLENLKSNANNYILHKNACTNHQVLYHKLKELHYDFIQHTHLEHNILFPKAIEIEKQLLQI